VVMNADVVPSEIGVTSVPLLGVRLAIAGTTDVLALQAQGGPFGPSQAVDQITFLSDGTVWTWQQLLQRVGTTGTPSGNTGGGTTTNNAPVLATALADATMLQGELLQYRIPNGTFADPDGGNLTYWAGSTTMGPASAWFDATTRSVIFTPGAGDVGEHEFIVTAVDAGGLVASDTFTLTVVDTNDAPFVAMPLMDVTVAPHATLAYQVLANAFVDVDSGDSFSYSAALADGSPLPGWLSLDSARGVISGLPHDEQIGTLEVRVTATDSGGLQAQDTFVLAVAEPSAGPDTAPYVSHAVADQSAVEDAPFSFEVPADTFGDADDIFSTAEGDHSCLLWNASQVDGSPLPAWLKFYAASRTFAGTPGDEAVGTVELLVTATDPAGQAASATFSLSVANVNDAPRISAPIADQVARAGAGFNLTIPGDAFTDPDPADVLSFSASRDDGSALPAWLAFDPATRTFAGTPASADAGSIEIAVTATDLVGESASDSFQLLIEQGNQQPSAVDDSASVQEDVTVIATGNVLANDSDPDAETVLQVATPGTSSGGYGTLTLAADGSYSYSLNNGADVVQSLAAGSVVTDSFAYSASDGTETSDAQLRVSVLGSNDAPTLARPPSDVTVTQGQAFQLSFAADTFHDVDAGDSLSYAATLADGSALPGWLAFDPTARAFSGIPGTGDVGTLLVEVTAADSAGATANAQFALTVAPNSAGETIFGTERSDHLAGTYAADTIYGLGGNDHISAGDGWDVVFGGDGNDHINGGGGNDILQGGTGNDSLVDGSGNGLLDGGSGNDQLTGGTGNQILAGGTGNDTLHLGSGQNVIAFNNGDGHDTVYADGGGSATLSLGGAGLDYADLRLEKNGDDLVLHTGADDQLTFKDWYAGKDDVAKLQIVLDSTGAYDPGSQDPLFDSKVETFDFARLVDRFDRARAETPALTSWALTNALLEFHLASSDEMALGGDLAYWYARNGGFGGMSVQAAQQVIGAPGFGSDAQQLHAFSGLQDGLVKLG
jgi:VCBS repeat-containing protein